MKQMKSEALKRSQRIGSLFCGTVAVRPRGSERSLSIAVRYRAQTHANQQEEPEEDPILVDAPANPYVPASRPPPTPATIHIGQRPAGIRRRVQGLARWCSRCMCKFDGSVRRIRCPLCGSTCCPACSCGTLAVLPFTRPCYPCRSCLVKNGPHVIAFAWSDFGLYEDRMFESLPSPEQLHHLQQTFVGCGTCDVPLSGWLRRHFCHICRLPLCRSCGIRMNPPLCDSCVEGLPLLRHPMQIDMKLEACRRCNKAFSFFRSRMRCRHCGDVVCPSCAPAVATQTSCICVRCARVNLFWISDDVLGHVLEYLDTLSMSIVVSTCRRLQAIMVLPYNAIERLEDYYEVDWTHDLLGEGAFGKVYSCLDRQTGERCAVKIIPKCKITSYGKAEGLIREISIHQALEHPHTVSLHTTLHTPKSVCMVMGLAGDSVLSDLLLRRGRLREWQAASIVLQILEFLHYLHTVHHVVHRDIKPDNLVLCADSALTGAKKGTRRSDTHVRVVDFGLARAIGPVPRSLKAEDALILQKVEENRSVNASEMAKHPDLFLKCTPCGTLRYCAPEVLTAGCTNKPVFHGNIHKRDIWSVGVLTYLLLSGRLPHKSKTMKDLQIELRRPIDMSGRRWNTVSPEGRMFIQWLCTTDPFLRPSALDAMHHAWFQRLVPLAPSCLRTCGCTSHVPHHAPTSPLTEDSGLSFGTTTARQSSCPDDEEAVDSPRSSRSRQLASPVPLVMSSRQGARLEMCSQPKRASSIGPRPTPRRVERRRVASVSAADDDRPRCR